MDVFLLVALTQSPTSNGVNSFPTKTESTAAALDDLKQRTSGVDLYNRENNAPASTQGL